MMTGLERGLCARHIAQAGLSGPMDYAAVTPCAAVHR